MEDIIISIVVAIITSVCSILGTLFIQKILNERSIRANALYLYLNLSQVKSHIDRDKKVIDECCDKTGVSKNEIMPMNYISPFDYIGVLSKLKDKMSEHEIMSVYNFYETVKNLDYKKMVFFDKHTFYTNFPPKNPVLDNSQGQLYRDSYNNFVHDLKWITNSDVYKVEIVCIISKLKKYAHI